MANLSSLRDLIEALEQGNRYHISIEFFNKSLARQLQLPRRHIIHATAFCDAVKERRNGLDRCIRCKARAMDKARNTGKPFGGHCTFGAYEFCYPVYKCENLLCIIFVGNVVGDRKILMERSELGSDDPLLRTMDDNITPEDCPKIAQVVASYILLLADAMSTSNENQINATIFAIKSYVDFYFYHDITLTSLTSMYHYNPKYLGTLFKQQLGVSFHEYLNDRRLRNARMLLEQSRETVLDVALKSGFNNVTYFNRLFRAKYNMTPTQYRVNAQNK